ncbi:MAG: sugar-transfer associated ATP-grasp domain-containing protein [Bacilli bacterium]
MGKIKYLFTRIANMNYKQMFTTINDIHEKTNKNRLYLFFDIINCGIKYEAGYMDYKLFEMYNLNNAQRKTIITRGINNQIIKKYNNPDYTKYFSNKILFNKKFNKYLLRDWMEVDENNFELFKTFTNKHPNIIVKPVSGSCGQNVEIIKVNNKNVKKVYENILSTKRNLVEEVATQCKEIASIYPDSINTLRIVTLNGHIVVAFLRIGNNHNVVDNFNHGGMVAPINISTGIIDYLAIDKQGNLYEKHPLTNESILWFQVPKWPRIKRFVENVAKEIPEVGYVGWDVSLNKDPFLIEGNEFPGHDVYQLPPHRSDGIGLLPVFERAMKGEQK